jgi:hypothetical protein
LLPGILKQVINVFTVNGPCKVLGPVVRPWVASLRVLVGTENGVNHAL